MGPIREAVKAALFQFLSPLYGWHGQQGWPLKLAVLPKELEAIVARVDGVLSVPELRLGIKSGDALQSLVRAVEVAEMAELMLPRLVNVAVAVTAVGIPGARGETLTGESLTPLENLQQAPTDPTQTPLTPIPVLPERC